MNFISTKLAVAGLTIALFSSASEAVVINYGEIGTGSSSSITNADVTVTGSSDIHFSDSYLTSSNGGLGVDGQSLDLGETLTFNFDFLVSNVFLSATDIDPFGNVTYGFNAYSGGNDLGFFGLPNHTAHTERFDLSALVGQSFDSFTLSLSASAPLGLVIEQLEYNQVSVPEPGSIALLGLGLAGLGFSRRNKKA